MVLTMSGLPASTAVATSATERKIAEQTRAGLMREGAQSLSSSIQISPMDNITSSPAAMIQLDRGCNWINSWPNDCQIEFAAFRLTAVN